MVTLNIEGQSARVLVARGGKAVFWKETRSRGVWLKKASSPTPREWAGP